ncbi:hypothetical protein DFJ63DRAFT_311110 [Scheffersomyces coipomensis]|uniref:uncharacterized protein n=1 Tax=Scheffersomyces coipomensis TaxID=1788519 RepID=UPI00315DF180
MEESEDQLYDDLYVAKFFKVRFPDLCYDLIVAIFKLLDTSTIILLQSLINDKYIKAIGIQYNDSSRIHIPYYRDQNYKHDESKFEEMIESEQSCNIMKELIGYNRYNVYPINLSFRETTLFPVRFIDQMLGKTKNFDISLTFDSLDYAQCHKLKHFRRSSEVTKISIEKVGKPKRKILFDLDLSKYQKLKSFRLTNGDNISNINLSSSFGTLRDLKIAFRFDEGYLSNFVNLESLNITIIGIFNLMDLPRHITDLYIKSIDETHRLISPSDYDWPKKIVNLTLNFDNDFIVEGFKGSNLPPGLKILTIFSDLPMESILPKLPSSLTELKIFDSYIEYAGINESSIPIDFSEILSPGIETMKVMGVNLQYEEGSLLEFPKRMIDFYINTDSFFVRLDDIIFENAKDDLEYLVIIIQNYSYTFSKLDFSEFTKLSTVTLEGCNINNLSSFKIPQSLKSLRIRNNCFKSIDEKCPFLSDSVKYPNLKKLHFEECKTKNISSTIKLPINLTSLTIPYHRNKELLLNIFKHESLLLFEIDSMRKPDIFDDFKEINGVNTYKTNIKYLTLSSEHNIFKNSTLKKIYKSVKLAMGKGYSRVKVGTYYEYYELCFNFN